MSGAPIPRAVELVATLSIQKKGKNPDRLKKGIINTDGAVTGSRLNGRVGRAFVRGDSGKRTLLSTPALRAREPSVLEPNDPFPVTGVGLGMCHLNDRGAGSVQLAKQFHDFLGLVGMQVASRFVRQQ
jgi:hypothetical protein